MHKIRWWKNKTQQKPANDKISSPAAEVRSPLVLDSPEFVQNPYPYLAWLREHQPLHRAANGAWVLTCHDDIVVALRDENLCNSPAPQAVVNPQNSHKYVCAEVANNIIPFMDGSNQVRLRKIIAKAWSTQLKRRPPEMVNFATALLEPLMAFGQFDLLEEFSTPLATATISDILGIPKSLQTQMQKDAADFFYLFTSFPSSQKREQTDSALLRLREQFENLIAQRKKSPQEDLISLLCPECSNDQNTLVIVDHLILLLADGIENVDSGITSGVSTLLLHPKQWQLLCDNTDQAASAAIECLRFESPAQYIGRVVSKDHQRYGQQLKQGDVVLLMLAAANRDPKAFKNPNELDISRETNTSLSFGRGIHSCIGASLTVKELEIALSVISQQTPSLRLADQAVNWQTRTGHRWPQPTSVNIA